MNSLAVIGICVAVAVIAAAAAGIFILTSNLYRIRPQNQKVVQMF